MFSLTKKALEDFDNSHDFERMCADILQLQGYKDIVPIAPRGGSDGGRDITFLLPDGRKGLACVTLRKDIKKKFYEDFSQRKSGEYTKYILFCTHYLTADLKTEFEKYCEYKLEAEFLPQDIEALRSVLDVPAFNSLRHYLKLPSETLNIYSSGSSDNYKIDSLEKTRTLRAEQITKIQQGQTDVKIAPGAKSVIHIITGNLLKKDAKIDLSILTASGYFYPPRSASSTSETNINGKVTYERPKEGSPSYFQVYKRGFIEIVETHTLEWGRKDGLQDAQLGMPIIPTPAYENSLLTYLPHVFQLAQEVGLEFPYIMFPTLLGIKGFILGVNRARFFHNKDTTIPDDELVLGEIELNSPGDLTRPGLDRMLKPAFDTLWNANGWDECLHYDSEGNWKG